jgi:hypothetical protein
MERESSAGQPSDSRPSGRDIRWPPPGLERLQGDLARVAGRGALAGAILVLPLLFVIVTAPDFATLGPLGDAWWVTMTLAVIGLAFAMDALIRAVTLLRRIGRALDAGYDRATIMRVLADRDRDMGFLLTGSRHFSVLSERERRSIVRLRLLGASLWVIAGIWLPVAFAVGLLLASRGVLSPVGFWTSTVLPPLAMYLLVTGVKVDEERRTGRARRTWHKQPWAADLGTQEAREWRTAVTALDGGPTPAAARPSSGRTLRYSAAAVALLAVVVILPTLTLVPTSAVGPILALIAAPSFESLQARAARVEALRAYAVPVDPALTPAEAGRLLNDLLHVGEERAPVPGERAPSRAIQEPWVAASDGQTPMGLPIAAFDDSIMTAVARGISSEQRAYLEGLAAHPARADFSRLARAGAVDIAAARFADPLPQGVTIANLPLPRFNAFRTGAYTHFGVAALELVNGRAARAEEVVREVISVGFLLGDGGATAIDNAVGFALIDGGSQALRSLYELTDQTAQLEQLDGLMSVAARAVEVAQIQRPNAADVWVRALPAAVVDSTVARGLRWEYFTAITTLSPCLNLHRVVFGPDEEYREFVESARESLVAYPSEAPIFELARRGWFGTAAGAEGTLLGRLLSAAMYGGEGGCGEIVRQLGSLGGLM